MSDEAILETHTDARADIPLGPDRPRLLWPLDWERDDVQAKILMSVSQAYPRGGWLHMDTQPLQLYARRLAMIDEQSYHRSLPEVYEDIYLEEGSSPKERVDRLMATAELSLPLLGRSAPLPDIPIKGEAPLSWYVHIERSVFEGAAELRFMAKKPALFKRGVFLKRDDDGQRLGDLVADDIPVWTLRFTPDDKDNPVILFGASQRVAEYELFPLQSNRNWFRSAFGEKPFPPNTPIEEQVEELFTRFAKGRERFDPHIAGARYLFSYFPSEYAARKVESATGLSLEQLTLYAGLQYLQSLGFRRFAGVDAASQPYLIGHREKGDVRVPVDYDKLFGDAFEKSGNPPFPYRLETNAGEFNLPDAARKNLPLAYVPFGVAFARNLSQVKERRV